MWPAEDGAAGSERGFGLIEVLIAVLVLSIGVLGLAQLQTISIRNANSAAIRLEAVNLAHTMLERMRSRRAAALNGEYDVGIGETSSAGGEVQAEIEDWKTALAASLPGGDGAIVSDGRQVTITTLWSEPWDDDLADGQTFVRLRSEP